MSCRTRQPDRDRNELRTGATALIQFCLNRVGSTVEDFGAEWLRRGHCTSQCPRLSSTKYRWSSVRHAYFTQFAGVFRRPTRMRRHFLGVTLCGYPENYPASILRSMLGECWSVLLVIQVATRARCSTCQAFVWLRPLPPDARCRDADRPRRTFLDVAHSIDRPARPLLDRLSAAASVARWSFGAGPARRNVQDKRSSPNICRRLVQHSDCTAPKSQLPLRGARFPSHRRQL